MKKIYLIVSLCMCCLFFVTGQTPKKQTSGEIYESIEKLNFLGSVLYLAAHPDDENTRLISYFATNVKARTAYLSITRGDGGQNLIGPELRELLGVIRTQELLAARKTDGGEQFFTRANDFGYSNHPDETLEIWNKDEVLNDVVAIIRKFKPDVIINRFRHLTPGTTHGHHTSSALLSVEAFDLAADKKYKTHLKNDATWNSKRLFLNTSWRFYGSEEAFEKADKKGLISVEVGSYFQNLGLSNGEIAALSRSQHQSQGFGSTGSRGSQTEYLQFLKGSSLVHENPFGGIDTSWNRVEGGKAIGVILKKVQDNFNFNNPSTSVNDLVEAYKLIQLLKDEHWKEIKSKEIKNIISNCAGLFLEAVSDNASTTNKTQNSIKIEAINRSSIAILLKEIEIKEVGVREQKNSQLVNNVPFIATINITIPENTPLTAPYWLTKKGSLGMFEVENKELIGLPETPKNLIVSFKLVFNSVEIPFEKEIIYKYNDPVKGEVYKPFELLPQVAANFTEKVIVFSSESSKKVSLKVKALKGNLSGKLTLCTPENWKVLPEKINFEIKEKGEEQVFQFEVFPTKNESEGIISPIIEIGDKSFSDEIVEIDYGHIPYQSVVMPSEAKVVRLNIAKKGQLIGYIQGAGDEIPTSLRQIGYTVVELKEDEITPEKLANFDAVVLGIRAYNTNDKIKFYQKYLFSYVEKGGTIIVQYNTNTSLKVDEVAPYPLKLSRERVTDENSEVRIINPMHELLNYPNKITESDFNGWVQERGLYFPNEWDSKFETVISMNDTGEKPSDGSILIANYGKGNYIYTGLSFFRELPVGVSGAYKLFANMLSVGKNNTEKPLKN